MLKNLAREHLVRELEGGISGVMQNCERFKLGKAHDKPHPRREAGAGEQVCLGRVSVDLAGPFNLASIGGGVYNMVLVDEYSRKSWVEILRSKDDAALRLKQSIAIWERQVGKPVKNMRSDRGG